METRLLVLFVIVSACAVFAWYIRWRSQQAAERGAVVQAVVAGKAGIVAITTDHCVQCERLQKPALQRIQHQRDDVSITWRTVDQEPELVKTLGILTVPSTVVHDAQGKVVKVNMGYTDETVLLQQLAIVSAPPHCS
ncbi:MAG: TlpA family protein disulfide reductase [Roseiflexaceae bacterium]